MAEVAPRTAEIDPLETELDRQINRSNRLRHSVSTRAFGGRFEELFLKFTIFLNQETLHFREI